MVHDSGKWDGGRVRCYDERSAAVELNWNSVLTLAGELQEKYGGRIAKQTRRMGASLDWSREAFTMVTKHS